ncbi:hypothetical protein K504DRAFT_467128 [Pleomassaria siparia CBS 279.74]|uniref:Uncharacterized protein n=1 Tax=Pleomassaria siparia CBS 279.74 TaxID=1314801 RepID=A0A6G1JQC8_9PLEO|nr:hypothetical protein K504DRAFT_467128 [Pleomassaria siparia CBS 279.74]
MYDKAVDLPYRSTCQVARQKQDPESYMSASRVFFNKHKQRQELEDLLCTRLCSIFRTTD